MNEDILENGKTLDDESFMNCFELYKRMVDLNPNAILLSEDSRFIYANKKAIEVLKADDIEQIKALNTIDIVHPRYRNEVAGRRVMSLDEGIMPETIEVQLLCMDKSVIDVELVSRIFVLGDKLLTLTTIREISKWKEMRRAYQERDVLINAIFDSTIDGILVVNESFVPISINNRLIDILNLNEDSIQELVGGGIFDQIMENMEDPELIKSIIGKPDSFVNEYYDYVKFKDGRVFNFYSCPLIIDGEITGRIWSFRDITKQAEAEEKLNRTNAELVEAIGELKKTQAQLIQKEKLAGIGQLAAGVAHEINNPLAYAISNIEILRKRIDIVTNIVGKYRAMAEYAGSFSCDEIKSQIDFVQELERKSNFSYIIDDMKELIDDSIEGLRKAGHIVHSLREFAGRDDGDKCDEYNINDGIENVLTLMENEFKYHVRIEKELGQVPHIKVNRGQINQVLMNMLQNSVRAIRLKGDNSQGIIKLKTYLKDKHIVCEIEDNGIGIKQENISKIFLPFYTTKDVGEGYGLGISIAYDIITNKHKGEIIVESVYEKGTTFIIRIPV